MLCLHDVPVSHGSHDSQKRSSPWIVLVSFVSYSSSVKSRYVFSPSVKVSLTGGRRVTVCHGWLYISSRPAMFCWDLSRLGTF